MNNNKNAREALKSLPSVDDLLRFYTTSSNIDNFIPLNLIKTTIRDSLDRIREEIKANKIGSIHSIETRKLGLTLIELGGGRKQITDKINFSVGFEKVVDVGSQVDLSTPLLILHAQAKENVDSIKKQIVECFDISTEAGLELKTIYKTIT